MTACDILTRRGRRGFFAISNMKWAGPVPVMAPCCSAPCRWPNGRRFSNKIGKYFVCSVACKPVAYLCCSRFVLARVQHILGCATTAPPPYKQKNKRANAAPLPLVSSDTPPGAQQHPPWRTPGAPRRRPAIRGVLPQQGPLVPSNTPSLAHPAAARRFGGTSSKQGPLVPSNTPPPSGDSGGRRRNRGAPSFTRGLRWRRRRRASRARVIPEGWGGGGDLPPRPRLKRFHRHRPAAGRENGLHIPMRFHAPVLTSLIDQYVVEAS